MLHEGAARLGCPLTDGAVGAFERYMALLLEWNMKMNLTAITQPEEIVCKHFLDSLTIAKELPTGAASVIDVGTGAGFPGIPLKLARPEIELTLVDALNKRVLFLRHVAEALGLSGVRCVHARAEDLGHDVRYRQSFDVCASRAVARLSMLAEYCLPLVKTGGKFISMKGRDAGDEICDAKSAISTLGGELSELMTADIPFTDITHGIIVVNKLRPTPSKYPRSAAKISKGPIK